MSEHAVAALRRSIAGLELAASSLGGEASFSLGHAAADAALGPLRRHALHEVVAPLHQSPAATGFVAGLVVRLDHVAFGQDRPNAENVIDSKSLEHCLREKPVPTFSRNAPRPRPLIWLRQDSTGAEGGELYAPGLAAFGLDPGRILSVRARDPLTLLKAAGDAFPRGNDRRSGIGAVVIELAGAPACLDLTASRRLLLAAREAGVTAILLRLADDAAPSAATLRWAVTAAPSEGRVRAHGPGRPRFSVTVLRNRHGATGQWIMEWDSHAYSFREPLPVALVPAPARRSDQAQSGRIRSGNVAELWPAARRASG